MLTAFKDGGRTDFVGSAVFRDDQADVVIALQDLVNAVMQEADTDNTFSGADLLGGTGTALGVLGDILVQLHQVLHSFIVALDLDQGVNHQLGCAGGIRVGQPDQALVFGLQQVVPGLGSFQAQAAQFFLVDHESQDALVNAVPVSFRIPVVGFQQVGGILGFISFQQSVLGCFIVGIVGAAEPDISGGAALFFGDLHLNLTGAQTLIVDFDVIQFFELLAGRDQVRFFAGAVDNQFAFILCCGDQFVHPALRERGSDAEHHSEGKQQSH